ncbi:MAG: uridine kinase [Deltaproteobacteria bacterium]|nr:uridine kinase [Deltaproteobacteria bacterium]
MKIIAITGGSGCGKTLFTNLLVERLKKKTAVLPLDLYYKDRPDQIPNNKYDFDSPHAFDFELYYKHLDQMMAGKSVKMPHFGYQKGKRESGFTEIIPEEYLVIEGLHVLFLSKIRELISFSFFMDSPLDVAVCRRCIRDVREHNVTAEYSLNQFLKFVRPAYFEYILPTKKYSNLIVENNFQTRLDLFIDDFLSKNEL